MRSRYMLTSVCELRPRRHRRLQLSDGGLLERDGGATTPSARAAAGSRRAAPRRRPGAPPQQVAPRQRGGIAGIGGIDIGRGRRGIFRRTTLGHGCLLTRDESSPGRWARAERAER